MHLTITLDVLCYINEMVSYQNVLYDIYSRPTFTGRDLDTGKQFVKYSGQ